MLKDDLKTLGLYDNVKNYGDAMNMIWSDSGAPIRNYPESLTQDEQEDWFEVVQSRMQAGENGYLPIDEYSKRVNRKLQISNAF
jgi:hypothetical protein